MNRIFLNGWNIDQFITYLKNDTLYQIDYKQAYVKKDNNTLYFYSYDTCILELNTRLKTIIYNMNKYSHTTGKQKSYILRNLKNDNTFNYYRPYYVAPRHKKQGYFMDLTLSNLSDFLN